MEAPTSLDPRVPQAIRCLCRRNRRAPLGTLQFVRPALSIIGRSTKLLKRVEVRLVKAVWKWQRGEARRHGAKGALTGGGVCFWQWFGSQLQLTPLHLLVAEATLLSAGGVLSALGLVAAGLTLAFANQLGEGGVWALVASGSLFGLGLILGAVGAVIMVVVGSKLTRIHTRIRELEKTVPQAPVGQPFSVPPRLVLARF